ncbi:unnamed protein product, partial [Prorocentrum cordatum]
RRGRGRARAAGRRPGEAAGRGITDRRHASSFRRRAPQPTAIAAEGGTGEAGREEGLGGGGLAGGATPGDGRRREARRLREHATWLRFVGWFSNSTTGRGARPTATAAPSPRAAAGCRAGSRPHRRRCLRGPRDPLREGRRLPGRPGRGRGRGGPGGLPGRAEARDVGQRLALPVLRGGVVLPGRAEALAARQGEARVRVLRGEGELHGLLRAFVHHLLPELPLVAHAVQLALMCCWEIWSSRSTEWSAFLLTRSMMLLPVLLRGQLPPGLLDARGEVL